MTAERTKASKTKTPKEKPSAYGATPGSPIASAVKAKTKKKLSAPKPAVDDPSSKVLFSPASYREEKGKGERQLKEITHAYDYRVEETMPGEDDEEEFDPFIFIKSLPPLPENMKLRRSPLMRKNCTKNISLALDLDETLVHCSVEPLPNAELTFSVNFNGMDYEVYVRTRPHLQTFLKQVSEWFECIVFTASQKVYADKLLDILDPEKNLIKHRLFRDSCVCIDGNYLKDLHILGRDMKKVVIVDNSVQAFGFQLNNGIPIESWFDNDDDEELLKLLSYLKHLKDETEDVRPLIKDTFGLEEFVSNLPPLC
jgi:CTD small phosphatase-like protein 2